jgi:hypothetical protein
VGYAHGMSELNTFNNADDEDVGDAVMAVVCAVIGIFALVVTCVVEPRVAVVLSGLMFLGGTVVAVASPRRRPVAAGLAFAGAAPALVIGLVVWVWAAAMVLPG